MPTLPFRPPLPWEVLLGFLRGRAVRGVEAVDARAWRRVVVREGRVGLIEVTLAGAALHLDIPSVLEPFEAELCARVVQLFDLDTDPAPIDARLAADPLLAPGVARLPGLRVPGAFDPFEMAVRAVLGQQISVAGATTLCGRLVERFGALHPGLPSGLDRSFPPAATLGALAPEEVARIGLPQARARTIVALASAVATGAVRLERGADPALTQAALVSLPGIGPWTAAYLAMRGLGWADALPTSDLAVRRALGIPGLDRRSLAAIEARADAWRPWRAYAVLHLWMMPSGTGG